MSVNTNFRGTGFEVGGSTAIQTSEKKTPLWKLKRASKMNLWKCVQHNTEKRKIALFHVRPKEEIQFSSTQASTCVGNLTQK